MYCCIKIRDIYKNRNNLYTQGIGIIYLSHVYSKHVLEDQSEEEPGISSETTLIAEHDRLAAEYHNERALLEEALRRSKDGSRNTSDDESTEEVECATVPVDEEPLDKLQLKRKTEPLKPILTKKKSDEDEVLLLIYFPNSN